MTTATQTQTPKEALLARGYIPAGDAAKRIGYTVQGIYKMLDDKRITGTRIGRARYVLYDSLKKYMHEIAPEAAKAAKL